MSLIIYCRRNEKEVTPIPGSVQEALTKIQEGKMEVEEGQDTASIVAHSEEAIHREIENERKVTQDLVQEGIKFFKKNSLHKACNVFTHTKEFVKGDIYLFVFDEKGICYAHGQHDNLVWSNLYDLQDSFGAYPIRMILETAQQGQEWVTYQWRNSTKTSYVQRVTKNGKTFTIGAGYYPHSKEGAVVNLVKSAVAHFNEELKSNDPIGEIFSIFSYPKGRFIFGDLYIFALDFDGTIWAQGDRPGLIGSNSKDRPENKEIFEKLSKKGLGEGIWIEYLSKGAPKRVYAEKVKDKKGKYYFIACGYYPETNGDAVQDLVGKAYQYLKSHGLSQSVTMFTDTGEKMFRDGDLSIFVMDYNGKILAHGENAEWIGNIIIDVQDEDGRYFVKEMISKARTGGGWLNHKINRAFQSIYVEPIKLGTDQYLIGSSFYPVSKRETMILLARSAKGYLEAHPEEIAFSEFVKTTGSFIRGDLDVMVFSTIGINLVYGDNFDFIWKDFINIKDDDGKPFVKLFINTVRRGTGEITYKLNGVKKIAYVQEITKGKFTYVVGSSYYVY